MELAEARSLLRSELLFAAAVAVPGFGGVVTHDPGPVDPASDLDGWDPRRGQVLVCSVTVQTGDPENADPAGAIRLAAEALRERGWAVEIAPVESGHHRAAASRDGFDVAIHAWDDDWRVTLTGQTPDFPA